MRLHNIHYEILDNLSLGPLSLPDLTRRSKETKFEERIGQALRALEDVGLVEALSNSHYYGAAQKYRRIYTRYN